MSGPYKARHTRGQYNQAGYIGEEERDMYIADVPAGSARDTLRDCSRKGYQCERPWNETPIFETADAAPHQGGGVKQTAKKKKQSGLDRLSDSFSRERSWGLACILAAAALLTAIVISAGQLMEGAQLQQSIVSYEQSTKALKDANDETERQYKLAFSGESIRNKAQNELHMLRPERVQTEKIYIRMPENMNRTTVQNIEEPGMDILDILLGLLSVFSIGE